MKIRRFAFLLLFLFLLLIPLTSPAEEGGESVYRIVDENGQTVTFFAGEPEPDDEYIAGDNRHYRVSSVDTVGKTAATQSLGDYPMPDVSWLNEIARPVSAAAKKAVAIYCTHSDESYAPSDGKSSILQGGGIYDVAESFKKALEKDGVTVYYSDENHAPHDAGAYRRSRATAASLAEKGVDAIMDIHRDGIPDPKQYEKKLNGEDVTKVRLLVGRSNQNADANKGFAAQLKAVGDKMYPGLIKDIYIGKGTYNQDLMSKAVLLEFGTYTNQKDDVLHSTGYMADVVNKTLYGGVKGPAAEGKAQETQGAWRGIGWLLAALVVGALIFGFAATGTGKGAVQKWKNTFREMTGGAVGNGRKDSEQ